ncbi:MAG: hypothetical protein NC127_01100 [Muribaculum sp.]|nr:hypothetical protein [Muribaculum sp.]
MTKRTNPYEKLSAEELDELIECYFDCTLSEDDELSLRKVLSVTSLDSPSIREAKAVMGYGVALKAKMSAKSKDRNWRTKWFRITGVAGAVAILLSIGAYMHHESTDEDYCVAYVNGQRINNQEAIMQMMKVDLLTMQAGSESVAGNIDSDFSALREAIGELN